MVSRVLVIDDIGTKIGLMVTRDAIQLASEKNLDLVEVAPNADPPVCKIMDYGKHKYQKQKRDRDAKKKVGRSQIKEVKLRIKTEQHDIDTKLRHLKKFLDHGDKVKLVIMFRGREMVHQDLGRALIKRLLVEFEHLGSPIDPPKMEGRNLSVIIAPLSKVQLAARERAEKKQKAADEKANGSAESQGEQGA